MANIKGKTTPLGTEDNPLSEEIIRQVFGGRLFTDNFLAQKLIQLANTESNFRIDNDEVNKLYDKAKAIFSKVSVGYQLNEDETQEEFIYPILDILKWEDRAIKQNLGLSDKNLRLVPDGLLFMDERAKLEARKPQNSGKSYQFGKVVLENKKFGLSLEDREEHLSAPSMQILTYLNCATVLSNNEIYWGILTNGKEWRLYYQKAQSVAEQFFSVRLDRIFTDDSLLLQKEDKLTCFKIFLLIFGKQAFQSIPPTNYSFHQLAIDDVKFYQQKITNALTNRIFDEIYKDLAIEIAMQAENATGEEVKQATLKILYRILFILYAEDRGLLPTENSNYYKNSLRELREKLKNKELVESKNLFKVWGVIKDLCRTIDNGDKNLGVPKYNGGLFKDDVPLLERTRFRIDDEVMVKILRSLSYDDKDYINYRNLNVEQLGSVYENLLERKINITRESGKPKIFVSKYDRKKTGSYYTPEELVKAIIKEATEPAYEKHIDAFKNEVTILEQDKDKENVEKCKILSALDPAAAILNQKICDPAMGSGHFLVSLTDSLTDQVIKGMGEAEATASEEWEYQSPLREDIDEIRDTIRGNAEKNKHKLNEEHLQDRHIIKRIVLKRCVYGVDKNPTAVELAKLSLWLHTFTVGAPLSFLDHHLKCGDSLFGLTMKIARPKIRSRGGLFERSDIWAIIATSAEEMQSIAGLSDSAIEQVEKSEKTYEGIQKQTEPLKKMLSLIHANDWLTAFASNKEIKESKKEKEVRQVKQSLINQILDEDFGDYFEVLINSQKNSASEPQHQQIIDLIKEVEALSSAEHFFHWEVEFPEVWQYKNGEITGGFDAIIGNPPWDKVRIEKSEWFESFNLDISRAKSDATRETMIAELEKEDVVLHERYKKARQFTQARVSVAKNSGIYKELNEDDINLYKLFVERARQLVQQGETKIISLVVPSGIASDYDSRDFFTGIVERGELKAFYDFENGHAERKPKRFFTNVHADLKFCALTQATVSIAKKVQYGCFFESVDDIRGDGSDESRLFEMGMEDFKLVNPNTGTAPLFRTRRDKNIVSKIYENHNILVNRKILRNNSWDVEKKIIFSSGKKDSKLFKDKEELEKIGAQQSNNNRYKLGDDTWLPVYEGKMFYLHDHRQAKIIRKPENRKRQRQPIETAPEEHSEAYYFPPPFFWVKENDRTALLTQSWYVAYRKVTASTNERSFIASILPRAAYLDSIFLLINRRQDKSEYLLYANFTSIPFDYIARNKIHNQSINQFVVEQLPVIDIDVYETRKFGDKIIKEIIREIILELVYTAHDLRGFAEDLGHVDDVGKVKKPFKWNQQKRLHLCAQLDAIYFILYGLTNDSDIEYIFNTFPNLDDREKRLELCLHYKNALLDDNYDILCD